MTNFEWSLLLVPLVGIALLTSVPIMVTIERRGSAWMQRRVGPNRVGPLGLLQPISDAIKLVFKEENIPAQAHKVLFILAPALAVLPPMFAFSVIPFSGTVLIGGQEFPGQIANVNVGLLLLLAITSLHVFSVLAAGWASNNKFSLMGALRASSQMISYEIAIGITITSLVMAYGTLDLREIVRAQEVGGKLGHWGVLYQPLAFLILWVCSFAETNRLPFDLPEGESELVAGYHTEYSGLKFGLFMMGEYVAMILASSFLVTLFFGGFNLPFISQAELRDLIVGWGFPLDQASWIQGLIQLAAFASKVAVFMWIFVWVRWTLPRFRYDQLMDLGWKVLLPLGILNVIATVLITFFYSGRGL
jgi:NADH-quinone oxidoreductase subunit H